jgi:hypothetical protein
MKLLLSALTAATVLVAAQAHADPVNDDLRAIRKEFCAGESFNECLASFRAEMASNQGYQEAALKVCPRLVATDSALRDLRNTKYRGSPDFDRGYQHVMTRYASQDFLGREVLCAVAVSDVPLHPKAYQRTWLKVEWTPADWQPLLSKEMVNSRSPAFQDGYHDGSCTQPCTYSGKIWWAPDRAEYDRGKEAGVIDRYRAGRKP